MKCLKARIEHQSMDATVTTYVCNRCIDSMLELCFDLNLISNLSLALVIVVVTIVYNVIKFDNLHKLYLIVFSDYVNRRGR